MRTATRPKLRVHAYYDGTQPLAEAYADVFALLIQSRRKTTKSSIRTLENSKPFHYDFNRNQKEDTHNGS